MFPGIFSGNTPPKKTHSPTIHPIAYLFAEDQFVRCLNQPRRFQGLVKTKMRKNKNFSMFCRRCSARTPPKKTNEITYHTLIPSESAREKSKPSKAFASLDNDKSSKKIIRKFPKKSLPKLSHRNAKKAKNFMKQFLFHHPINSIGRSRTPYDSCKW